MSDFRYRDIKLVLHRGQFHKHFMYEFFVQMSFRQLFLHTCWLPKQRSYKKFGRKMLMKLTTAYNYSLFKLPHNVNKFML